MVAHRALCIAPAQRTYFHQSGLAPQWPILNAGAFQIPHRSGNQRESHAARYQANHGLHLPRMLGDAWCKPGCMAMTDDQVVETRTEIARRDDEALFRERA